MILDHLLRRRLGQASDLFTHLLARQLQLLLREKIGVGSDLGGKLLRLPQQLSLFPLPLRAKHFTKLLGLLLHARQACPIVANHQLGVPLALVCLPQGGHDFLTPGTEMGFDHWQEKALDEIKENEKVDERKNNLGHRGRVFLNPRRGGSPEVRQEEYRKEAHPIFLPRIFSAICCAITSPSSLRRAASLLTPSVLRSLSASRPRKGRMSSRVKRNQKKRKATI